MLTIDELTRIAAFLRAIGEGSNPPDARSGVCSNFLGLFKAQNRVLVADHWLENQFRKWPKFSGSWVWPIPAAGRNRTNTPNAAYGKAMIDDTLWSKRTEYGKMRRELCLFIADQAQAQADDLLLAELAA